MGKSFNKEKLLNLFVGTDDLRLRYKNIIQKTDMFTLPMDAYC